MALLDLDTDRKRDRRVCSLPRQSDLAFQPGDHVSPPGQQLKLWQVATSALLLLVITALVLLGRRHRYLPVGWFWFLGTLVPTIGLMQVGRQALADRYAYQSFLGLFILVCWGISDWARQRHLPQAALPAQHCVVLLALRRGDSSPDRLLVGQSDALEPHAAGHRQQLGCA